MAQGRLDLAPAQVDPAMLAQVDTTTMVWADLAMGGAGPAAAADRSMGPGLLPQWQRCAGGACFTGGSTRPRSRPG